MNKIIFPIVALFTSFSTFTYSQSRINGVILDTFSYESIPFVHILKKDGSAIISDENGYFNLNQNIEEVSFSAIGYEKKKLLLSNNDSIIFLNPQIYLLPDVKVLPQKTSMIEIGNIEKIKGNDVNAVMSTSGAGYRVVKFIENKNLIEGKIRTVSFYLADKARYNQQIRLLLFSVDSVEQKPHQPIISKSIIISLGKKKKWNEIDISNLNISVPLKGFYVGLEFLPIFEGIKLKDKLSIGLINKENKKLTWLKMIDGKWFISDFLKTYDGEIANLMVKIKIETPLSRVKKISPRIILKK